MTTTDTTTVRVTFEFVTAAPQDRAVLRRSLRNTLDSVAERYAGMVQKGTVHIEVNPAHTVEARFQGIDPGFGKATV